MSRRSFLKMACSALIAGKQLQINRALAQVPSGRIAAISHCPLRLDLNAPCGVASLNFAPQRYFRKSRCDVFVLSEKSWQRDLGEILDRNYDVILNLYDSPPTQRPTGDEVVRALEQSNTPFTGARSEFFDMPRSEMKAAALAVEVLVPKSLTVSAANPYPDDLPLMRFPMLVKHPHSYASEGLIPGSKVFDRLALEKQISRNISLFGGALVEEFIEGREFTVLVAEQSTDKHPWALPPLEIIFPAGMTFYHFDNSSPEYKAPTFAILPPSVLATELMKKSSRIFRQMKGSGYARLDFRVDCNGAIYFLEINPNCGIFGAEGEEYRADHILLSEPEFAEKFTDVIIGSALAHQKLSQKSVLQNIS